MEIERKWLVAALPAPMPIGGQHIRQGYVARDGSVEVRVRLVDATSLLTIKVGAGLARREVELEIGADEADELWPATEGRRIEKMRYRVPAGDHVAEVDVYEGALAGLRTVEVEFASEADAASFVAPAWFGDEVTGDGRWSNAALAANGRPEGTR
jgi:CYTH domain-containing protein